MERPSPYYDFCIPYQSERQLLEILGEAYNLGYRTVAIEQVFDHTKRDANIRGDIFPPPESLKAIQAEFDNRLKILQRLTIIYADVGIAHAMTNSLNLRKYNFIAGQPKTDAALNHCCTAFTGDILTFDSEVGAKLLVNRKAYSVAVKRQMYFEIKYSPAIVDKANRKDMIKVAHNYCMRGKSKNIIFSSGAKDSFQLRGPNDVANLGYIFGLSEDQGKNAVNKTCRDLYFKAESRRWGKTIMVIKSSGPIVFDSDSEVESDDSENSQSEGDSNGASGGDKEEQTEKENPPKRSKHT